jgi:hypothetical protein
VKLSTVVKQVLNDPAFRDIVEKSGDQVIHVNSEAAKAGWQQESERMYKPLEYFENVKKRRIAR